MYVCVLLFIIEKAVLKCILSLEWQKDSWYLILIRSLFQA